MTFAEVIIISSDLNVALDSLWLVKRKNRYLTRERVTERANFENFLEQKSYNF
jgi:hypothetical protein